MPKPHFRGAYRVGLTEITTSGFDFERLTIIGGILMKRIFAAGALLALTACMEAEAPMTSMVEAGPLDTAAAFDAAIVGRTLTLGDNNFVVSADGTMAGTFNDAPLLGTWSFEGGRWCRTLTQHSTRAATDDCQSFAIERRWIGDCDP